MKEELGTLDFEVNFRGMNELPNLSLPVEIRLPNLKMVTTALTSEKLKLEPGQYLVISKLPAGQELFGHVEIKAKEKSTAVLKLAESEESPHETEALQHYLIADRQKVLSDIKSSGSNDDEVEPTLSSDASAPTAQLRVFSGNLLSGNAQRIRPEWESKEMENGLRGFQFSGSNALQIVQLLQTNAQPLNMILPAMQENSCRVFVTSLIGGKYTLDTHLDNSVADMILRYSQKGFYQQTELLSKKIDAEDLLIKNVNDQITAAVGAYALLRFNELGKLRDWTEKLRQWFEWLPDGSAIRGEHLARMGKHEEAITAFLEIEHRGLPIFSDGLSFATDRLSAYVGLKKGIIDEDNLQKIKNLLSKLQKFASYTDFREPFTTFTGLDVNEPSIKSLTKIRKDKKAINLTNLDF